MKKVTLIKLLKSTNIYLLSLFGRVIFDEIRIVITDTIVKSDSNFEDSGYTGLKITTGIIA